MNNVYFPVQVVTLLTRLAHLVSTISISNHYFSKSENTNEPAWSATLQWFNEKWSVLSSVEADVSTNTGGEQPRPPVAQEDPDVIHMLLQNPALYNPLRVPRYPLVLCHGLYGFDTRGPSSFRMHYWANVLNVLRGKLGAEVIVTAVPSTGSVSSRSESLDKQLYIKARGRGVNFLAHSMGGLDCRYLISHIKPTDYVPLSLTTISTPHRGSPFMDWCAEYLGLGRVQSTINAASSLLSLPSTLITAVLDSPAYANLTSNFLNDVFNPTTPDDPSVKYFSVAGRMSSVNVLHPLWWPKLVLDSFEQDEKNKLKAGSCSSSQDREWGNDGLVTVQSAKWGEFLGIMEECDHWQMRGARGIEFGVDLPGIPSLNSDWSFRDWSRFATFWNKSLAQEDDAIVKSSTDKLSAVVDYLTERAPKLSLSQVNLGSLNNGGVEEESREKKSELETKKDLERFYIALCRKIYDEGL